MRVDIAAEATVLDLGCGRGGTLKAVADRLPGVQLVGFDVDEDALEDAARLLRSADVDASLRAWNLEGSLPVEDSSVDVVVCHNVLECLARPERLLDDARRVLRPGGQAIWSHTDFAALLIGGPDADLTGRIVHAYANSPQPWMDHADGFMGRKLPGLVRRSGLALDVVEVHTTVSADLTGYAADRVREIVAILSKTTQAGSTEITAGDIHEWSSQIKGAARDGDFFYAEPAIVIESRRSQNP